MLSGTYVHELGNTSKFSQLSKKKIILQLRLLAFEKLIIPGSFYHMNTVLTVL